jgi:predicted transcriptional regulator
VGGKERDVGARRGRGELESEVLAALWAADEALTPGQVHSELEPTLAYNTVQTILIRLYDKGLLLRQADGRTHLYRPAQAQADLAAQQMHEVLGRGPDHTAVLQRFVDTLSPQDSVALRALVAGKRKSRP